MEISSGCKITPFMIRFGFGGSRVVPTLHYGAVSMDKGHVVFDGRACFAAGSTLDISGEMHFGKNFSCNKNAFISCSKKSKLEMMLCWGGT